MSVVVVRNPSLQPRWLVVVVGWTSSFFDAASLHCNHKRCFGNSETPHRCNALLKHLSAVIFVRYESCWWWSDQKFCDESQLVQKFLANHESSDLSILNLFLLVLLTALWIKINVTFRVCIAYHMHLGTLGELTCIHMETSILILYLSCRWCCYPITKCAATEPRASCVLQSCDCH
jgi:hypothetical protein